MRLPNDKALPEGGRPDRVRQPLESIGIVGLCCGKLSLTWYDSP